MLPHASYLLTGDERLSLSIPLARLRQCLAAVTAVVVACLSPLVPRSRFAASLYPARSFSVWAEIGVVKGFGVVPVARRRRLRLPIPSFASLFLSLVSGWWVWTKAPLL